MPLHTPHFWQHNSRIARILRPLAGVYVAASRLRSSCYTRQKPPIPVICVGNVVAGGAGKTPTTQALVRLLQDWGFSPHVLTRGYGGKLTGPVRVDIAHHRPDQVGDEPLMHAAIAPTWVARHRRRGAQAAAQAGAQLMVMDDGLQNRSLEPTISLLVLDGTYGLGNGMIMPAGPLREDFSQALRRSDAVVLIGEDTHQLQTHIPSYIPVLHASIAADANAARLLKGCKVIGFCGLARPEKFFTTLRATGAEVIETISFPDHHLYTSKDLDTLVAQARNLPAYLVTTQKDWMNIPTRYHGHIQTLPIRLIWEDPAALQKLLLPQLVERFDNA